MEKMKDRVFIALSDSEWDIVLDAIKVLEVLSVPEWLLKKRLKPFQYHRIYQKIQERRGLAKMHGKYLLNEASLTQFYDWWLKK